MGNPSFDSIIELKNLFHKLANVLSQTNLTLGNVKLIKKNLIDDILCCIEIKWPREYKAMIERLKWQGAPGLRTDISYQLMLKAIKNKFFCDTSHYFVRHKKALQLIASIIVTIEEDISYAIKSISKMS